MTWTSDDLPESHRISARGWLRVVVRGSVIVLLITLCLVLLLLVRLFEKPLCGQGRPASPYITCFVCRSSLWLLGIRYRRIGSPMSGAGAVVANHSSWLDIFALNAAKRIYFVAKAEVSNWPGIGALAKATGTVFIARNRQEAATHVQMFKTRLSHGHKLLFFPEGTSTDGLQVLPFKPTLFAAFFDDALRETLSIQPVTVVYEAPEGGDPRTYGWWGDMEFGPHMLSTLALAKHGCVSVHYHDPVQVIDFKDRKVLAATLRETVNAGLISALEHRAR